MYEKGNFSFSFSFCVTTIFFTILVSTAIIFGSLILNVNYTAMAQEQQEQPIINDPN